jgi:signal transduction histidine kinase/ligand-binding sensor domain-containing protein
MRSAAIPLLALLSLAHPSLVLAERLPTKVFTTAEGLANNVVNRIVRDSRGYLWFCTREGLSRFDGYVFITYGIDDGLPSAVVNDLIETKEGIYWIATSKGLVRFDPLGTPAPSTGARGVNGETRERARLHREAPARPMFRTFLPDTDPRTHDVMSLFQDRAGGVWVGTALGLYRLEDRGGVSVTFAPVEGAGPEVTCLAQDTAGAHWIGTTTNGLFRRLANQRLEHYTVREGLPANDIHGILVDRQGRIWVGTGSSGLALLTLDPLSQRPFVAGVYSTHNGLPSNWINQIFEAGDRALWAGTTGGLVQILPAGKPDEYRFRTFGAAALGLAHPGLFSVAEDRHQNLWIGSVTGAAKILSEEFTIFGAAEGIPSTATLVELPNGGVVAMEASGLWRFIRFVDQRFVVTELPLSNGTPSWGWNQMFLVDRVGDWWIGTRTGVLRFQGVDRFEQLARATPVARYAKRDGLAAEVVIRLFEDSRSDIWIATVGEGALSGLTRWERRSGALHHYTDRDGLPPFDRFYVSSFAEDRAGNVWIGFSGDGGVVRYRRGRFERFWTDHGVPTGSIRNLVIDARNRLWGASSRGGLLRIDRLTEDRPEFSNYTTAQGLSSNEVTAVVEDRLGRIYAGTARGLDRLDPTTGLMRSYRAGDDLPIGEMQAAIRDRAGVLWASYNSGLVRIVPTDDPPSVAPSVLITGLRVAGQKHILSALGQSELPYFELPWNRNSLEVEFVSPGFGPADGLRYQIRLEGGDSDWSPPSEQRSIVYANLASGRYRFQARAVNADGVMSGTTAGFSFTILPPIWQRWSFRTFVGLLVSALAYAAYRYRVSRLLEVAAMRTRIATDLHDDIGANLTRIAVLSEVVRRQGHANADEHLASIATVARESVTAMSDIVWAISPGRDGLNDLTRKMREHAEEVFAAGDTELTFAAPEISRDMRLSVDMRRDIYLIFKEAINNAARHARCSHVQVGLRSDGSRVILSVVDDGQGFGVAAEDQGNGLTSMRNRADRLGARLDITSRSGAGTTVLLEVPQHRIH